MAARRRSGVLGFAGVGSLSGREWLGGAMVGGNNLCIMCMERRQYNGYYCKVCSDLMATNHKAAHDEEGEVEKMSGKPPLSQESHDAAAKARELLKKGIGLAGERVNALQEKLGSLGKKDKPVAAPPEPQERPKAIEGVGNPHLSHAVKTCKGCGNAYPTNSFYRSSRHKDGLLTKCKKCTKLETGRRVVQSEPAVVKIETKVCNDCKKELPIGDFHHNRHYKDGFLTICKKCRKARDAKYTQTKKSKKGRKVKIQRAARTPVAPPVAPVSAAIEVGDVKPWSPPTVSQDCINRVRQQQERLATRTPAASFPTSQDVDPEVFAIGAVLHALSPLSPAARQRVTKYAMERLGDA